MEVNGLNVFPVGEKTLTHSYNRYDVAGLDTENNTFRLDLPAEKTMSILFQDGNPAQFGKNGVTLEVLMEIARHRLSGMQEGPYACQENMEAILLIDGVLKLLYSRGRRVNQPNKQG